MSGIKHAYIINGGSALERKNLAAAIDGQEKMAMMGRYEDPEHPDELAILHAYNHSNFKDMNISKIKQLIKETVGENTLPSNFVAPRTFSEDNFNPRKCFGVIKL